MPLSTLTVKKLKKLCILKKIKCKGKGKKQDIINDIHCHNAVIVIQKNIRKKLAGSRSHLIDPISLEIIRYPIFHYRPKGKKLFIYYNLDSIINYIKGTGVFIDPKTREPYSDYQIELLTKLVGTKTAIIQEQKHDMTLLNFYLDEYMSELRDLLEITFLTLEIEIKIRNLSRSLKRIIKKIMMIENVKYIFDRIIEILNNARSIQLKHSIKINEFIYNEIYCNIMDIYQLVDENWPY